MFGYVTANYDGLSAEAQQRYKSYYCGLCRCLGEEYGVFSRMTLTYDMTFLTLLLSGLLPDDNEVVGDGRCFVHPLKKRCYRINKNTYYAADMNIILSYYSLMDKWVDDKNLLSIGEMMILRSAVERVKEKDPKMAAIVKSCLKELSEVEKSSVLNPDVPADIFGRLLGNIFVKGDCDGNPLLYSFGYSLGRFIYIADAVCDFKRDLKREQYNPLVTTPKENFEGIIRLLLSDCTEKYSRLKEEQGCRDEIDSEIIENILYSGVWTAILPTLKTEKEVSAE